MEIKVLMCGPSITDGGGMASVAQNYIMHLNGHGVTINYLTTHKKGSKLKLIVNFVASYFKFVTLFALRRYDLAHIHMTYKGSTLRKLLLSFTAYLLRIPYILHIHTDYSTFYNRSSLPLKHLINKSFRMARCVIVLDNEMGKWVGETVRKCNVCIIANGVEMHSHNPYNRDSTDVLFLGSLCRRKGIHDVCKCIKILDATLPQDVKFLLCGEDAVGNLKETITNMGILHRIGHFGWISNEQKEDVFHSSAIMILPSYQEGLPMSILESMAHGIPCISTTIAGIPSVIRNGENGILITPGDVAALADSIQSLISNPMTRNRFSREAFNTIKDNFTIGKMMADTMEVYRNSIFLKA